MNDQFPSQTEASFDLLQTRSLSSLVQHELEQMILTGELAPGSKIPESQLAKRLSVSRGPIREAFRSLVEKGLLCVEKHRGVCVRALSPSEADHIFEVRLALEALIVRKLAADPERTKGSELKVLLAEAEKLACQEEFAASHACNMQFHSRLAELTGNPTLLECHRQLSNEIGLFRHQSRTRSRDATSLRSSIAAHQTLLATIEQGNSRLAGELIYEHVEASRKRLQKRFTEQKMIIPNPAASD